MTPLVVHVFDLWLSFHSLHYTDVSPIKMTMTLCYKTILKTLSSQFHVFHEGFLRFLHNINLPNRPFNKCDHEIFLSEKEHHVVQEDAWTLKSFFSCNIWLLSYFIDLQIVCICLVCHRSYLYDSSIYLFFLIAFVADVMKKELMFMHTYMYLV